MHDLTRRHYKLTIAYDGTAYCGWQVQPNGISIQQLIEEQASILTRETTAITGSGRTDAGVHALGQIAHFHSPEIQDLFRFHGSLNALLPPDIRILKVEEVPPTFHARYSATGKTYHYRLHLDRVPDPFKRFYSLHVKEKINLDLLQAATVPLLGTHDFTSFANEAHQGSAAKDAVRTLTRLDVVAEQGGVRLEFSGDGFLYKMVRNIVGTLLEVASGKRLIDDLPAILAAKDRTAAGQAAPPHGLFLIKVEYNNH
jgi:tRNA pseudouridine38-40 synthase